MGEPNEVKIRRDVMTVVGGDEDKSDHGHVDESYGHSSHSPSDEVLEMARLSTDASNFLHRPNNNNNRAIRAQQHSKFNRLEADDADIPSPAPSAASAKPANFGMLLRQLKTQDMYGAEFARKRKKARIQQLQTLDHVASIITLLQCAIITCTGVLAALAAETAWIEGEYESFVSTEWTTFLQSLTMLLSVASLVIFYIESRVEVIMLLPYKRWFWPWYFPSAWEACVEVILYCLHCPPMLFDVPLIVCTSLRTIFLFRLCKFHPDVRSIRFNQIMTGECPNFSAFFFYKTIVRTSPLVAIVGLAVFTTPVILFIYLQTSRLDEGFADNPESPLEVLWKILWFVIAQESPDTLPTARVSAVLAAIVSMALSTMIFTGLLGSLEMDSAQSAQYELVYRKQVLDDVRNLAAKTIQCAFRYSRKRTPKTKKIFKKTVKAFRAKLAIHIELREKDRSGGSVAHSLSHLISTTEELTGKMDRLKGVVEGKHAALYNLDTTLHSQTLANLSKHFENMLAKQDENTKRHERAQSGTASSLSALQRDLHDVAVENMKALQVRQEEHQKANFAELNRATEYLVQLTNNMSRLMDRHAEDREFLQTRFQDLQQQLQSSHATTLQDMLLKLRASQQKGAEELQMAIRSNLEQSQQQLLQQIQKQFEFTQVASQKTIGELVLSLHASQQRAAESLQQTLVEKLQTIHRQGVEELQMIQEQRARDLHQALHQNVENIQIEMQQGLADLWAKVQSQRKGHDALGLPSSVPPPPPAQSSRPSIPPPPPR